MSLKQILTDVLSGNMTLDEVKEWVQVNKHLYQRPPLTERLKNASSHEERDSLIDEYSDWEIRAHELNRLFREYTHQAHGLIEQDTDVAVRIARTLHVLSELSTNPEAEPYAAFQLGYILWACKQFFDAADILSEALIGLRRSSQDHLLEITALSYLTDALRQDKQFDGALNRSNELLEKATEYGFRGHVALALRDKGQVLASKGRKQEALDCLRKAVQLRRTLNDEEVKEQAVVTLEAFLDTLGPVASRFGQYDEAIEVFGELAELEGTAGHLDLKARAISHIGHTYSQAGETELAVQYLLEAADVADLAGASWEAKYWRTQADAMKGGPIVDSDLTQFHLGHEIEDGETAYLLNAQAQQLAVNDRCETAELMAHSVLEWAQRAKDTHMEISARNTLSVCYKKTNRTKEAIEELQKGIQLADWANEYQASMVLRYNLAKIFLEQKNYQRSVNILLNGIGISQHMLSQIETSEFRQQVIAGSLSLYELYALVLSHHEHQNNHLNLLSMTERVRATNLYSWLLADHFLEGSNISPDLEHQGLRALRELRAVEVELEVRHLTRRIPVQQVASLQTRREASRDKINSIFQQAGLPTFQGNTEASENPLGEMERLIEEVLEPHMAIVCLFSVPEGICPVTLFRENNGPLKTSGRFISWDSKDRQEALSRWTGNLDFRQGRGILSISQRDLNYLGASKGDSFSELMRLLRKHLADRLVEIIKPVQTQRLIVVPHRELALIPYWDVMDRCESIQSITVAPSLNVLRLCLERKRQSRGLSVLVGDKTRTLPQAQKEIEYVKTVRNDTRVAAPDSFDEFKQSSEGCSLLHIAAHGLFNPNNPYLSGFLISERETAKDLFVQYASLPSLELSDEPKPGSIRLMTVAECMAELSLNSCRLAVLSTCESGIARPHGGGEMTGLPASLLVAGAKSVIASLWPVNDTATAYLMQCFYDIWEGGTGEEPSPSASLAHARLKLRNANPKTIRNRLGDVKLPEGSRPFSDPIYTDAFQCFGSW